MSDPTLLTVEGRWAVEALLRSEAFRVRDVVVESGRHLELRGTLAERAIPFRELSKEELQEESGYAFHRGVYAVAERPEPEKPSEAFLKQAARLLVPVRLADPGNLGTVIRSAAAFGCDGVILEAGKGADVYSRKSIRASATALFRIPIFEVGNLSAFLSHAQENGFVLYGTSLGSGTVNLPKVTPARKSLILLGTESDGLPEELERQCDEKIRIPMNEGLDSLNVAASAAIVLYEFSRHQSDSFEG